MIKATDIIKQDLGTLITSDYFTTSVNQMYQMLEFMIPNLTCFVVSLQFNKSCENMPLKRTETKDY